MPLGRASLCLNLPKNALRTRLVVPLSSLGYTHPYHTLGIYPSLLPHPGYIPSPLPHPGYTLPTMVHPLVYTTHHGTPLGIPHLVHPGYTSPGTHPGYNLMVYTSGYTPLGITSWYTPLGIHPWVYTSWYTSLGIHPWVYTSAQTGPLPSAHLSTLMSGRGWETALGPCLGRGREACCEESPPFSLPD